MSFPISNDILQKALKNSDITDISLATIRQTGDIARFLKKESQTEFLHLEMGVPGLKPEKVGVDAERKALDEGVASIYPNMFGIPQLKNEASRFIKAFLDIDISPDGCVPTVGSMQGSFASYLLCSLLNKKKDTILFIDPGFPVQRAQVKMLGINSISFDIYDYRGEKLKDKLESYLSEGNISAITYSSPNNPSWISLTESELRIIGELATKYDVLIVEDLAYMGMDFRAYLGEPFKAPFQPTVARYTDNYILLISASKIFSYAGQRIAITAVSDKLWHRSYPDLKERTNMARLGDAYVLSILYGASAGVSHTAQYAIAAMFKAASDGELDFVGHCQTYGERAKMTKDIFKKHGFHIVYDKDMDRDVSDGFFYTVGYGTMEGSELMKELLLYGICTIALDTTGSIQDGVRICVSQLNEDRLYTLLDERLTIFAQNHKIL